MAASALSGQGIFEDLQRKIDEDTAVKDVSGEQDLAHEPLATRLLTTHVGHSRDCPDP